MHTAKAGPATLLSNAFGSTGAEKGPGNWLVQAGTRV